MLNHRAITYRKSCYFHSEPLELCLRWECECSSASANLGKDSAANLIQSAYDFAVQGISVFPIPFASKEPYLSLSWKLFTVTRLLPEHVIRAFVHPTNLAVVSGQISNNLMIIDAESEAEFDLQLNQLRKRGIPIYAICTGGARRGGHFYLRVKEGAVNSVASQVMQEVEIRGEGRYSLGAYSVHPHTGHLYLPFVGNTTNEPPWVSIDDLDWFVDRRGKSVVLTIASGASHRLPPHLHNHPSATELSSNTRKFLTDGAAYGTRNDALYRATRDMYGAGFSIEEIHKYAGDRALMDGQDQQSVSATIDSACSKAATTSRRYMAQLKGNPVKVSPDEQNARRVMARNASSTVHKYPWDPRTADRRVFNAVIQRLLHFGTISAHGHLHVRASQREIAEAAHCTAATARVALRRLERNELLFLTMKDPTTHANFYTLGNAVNQFYSEENADSDTTEHSVVASSTLLEQVEPFELLRTAVFSELAPPLDKIDAGIVNRHHPLEDLLEAGALGEAGLRILVYLQQAGGRTIREIAFDLNLKDSQVQSRLRLDGILRRSNLVELIGKHYYASQVNGDQLIDQVLLPAGKYGNSAKRRRRHLIDRSENLLRMIENYRKGHTDNRMSVTVQAESEMWHGEMYELEVEQEADGLRLPLSPDDGNSMT